jgi:hypothetical protein
MSKYVEYNLINNIPILYPHKNKVKYNFSPRYTIADEHNILYCFDKLKQVYMQYKYVKVSLNKTFHTTNNEISALFCYVMTDSFATFDVDFKNFEEVVMWLKNDVNHHYVLITTPILKYHDTYYTIANNNGINKVYFDIQEVTDDTLIIDKLIKANAFTICDIHNIIISLYQNSFINKKQFLQLHNLINTLMKFCYTNDGWLDLLINHRLLNACDIPLLYLLRKPHNIDQDLINLYDWSVYKNCKIYMQTFYKKDILITNILSGTYANMNAHVIHLILDNSFWISKCNMSESMKDICTENDIFCSDYYALFAAIVNNKSMWKLWETRKSDLIPKLVISYNNNIFCMISDVLSALFKLYTIGFEDMQISKKKIRIVWLQFFDHCENIKSELQRFIEYSVYYNHLIQMPFVFLLDVNKTYDINWMQEKYISYSGDYKYTSLTKIICEKCHNDNSLYFFHKHVIQKRMIYTLLCIYRKFNMFSNNCEKSNYMVGVLLINFLEKNMNYMV